MMDKEVAEILAAAMNNMAESNKMVATTTAVQAEAHALIALKMDELTNTIRGAQALVDRKMKRTFEQSRKNADEMLGKVRG